MVLATIEQILIINKAIFLKERIKIEKFHPIWSKFLKDSNISNPLTKNIFKDLDITQQ